MEWNDAGLPSPHISCVTLAAEINETSLSLLLPCNRNRWPERRAIFAEIGVKRPQPTLGSSGIKHEAQFFYQIDITIIVTTTTQNSSVSLNSCTINTSKNAHALKERYFGV